MRRNTTGAVAYYTFDTIPTDRLSHGVFTRHGGVSEGHYETLNVGLTIGDNPAHVAENTRRMARALGMDGQALVWPKQVHSATVIHVTQETAWAPEDAPQADAVITGDPGVGLMMRFADCVPVLLYDEEHHAVGMAHAGWRGTAARVVDATLEAMAEAFDTQPEAVTAGIGPSISGERYEVGPEVIEAVRRAFGGAIEEAILPPQKPGGNPHLDLWAANRIALEQAGVQRIEVSGLCTHARTDDFYSYRGEQHTGRFGVVAVLGEGAR